MGTVPTVLDQSMRGERAFDTYSLSPKERIVFRGQEVDDRIASLLVARSSTSTPRTPSARSSSTSTRRGAWPTRSWRSTR